MRLGVDATPLLGRRTGVGRYVAGLLAGLAELPDAPEVTLAAFTWRGARAVPAIGGARPTGRRVPARALQAAWRHLPVPPVEWLGVHCEVFHATNYVLPPTRRATGVLSVHDLSFALHPETVDRVTRGYRDLVPRGLARAAVVLTLSHALADEVSAFYQLDRARVRTARPGVDPEWLATPVPDPAWRAGHGIPEHYLLFVGTQEPRKNLPVLLEGLRRLGPDAPPL
ncbi:MAG: glycosyltransferase, partial [Mycobacteriales bacterium]